MRRPVCSVSILAGAILASSMLFGATLGEYVDPEIERVPGELAVAEQANLGIWHDSNRNGASESGEVRSLAFHGITGLSCAYEDGDGIDFAAFSPDGVRTADGRTRPSYDVILRSVPRHMTSR